MNHSRFWQWLGFIFFLLSFPLHAQETTFPLSDAFKAQKTLIFDLTGLGTFEKVRVSDDGKHFFVLYTKDKKTTLWVDGKIVAEAENENLYPNFQGNDLFYQIKRRDYLYEYFKNGKSLGQYGSLSVHISPDKSLEIYEVHVPGEKFSSKKFLIINGKKQEEFDDLQSFRFTDEGHEFVYIGSNRKKAHKYVVSTENYLIGNHYKLGPYDRIDDIDWSTTIGKNDDLFIGTQNKMDYLISKGKIIDQAPHIDQVKRIQGKLFYKSCEDENCFNPSQGTPDDLFGICKDRELHSVHTAGELVQEAHSKLWAHWGNEKLGPYEYVGSVGPHNLNYSIDKRNEIWSGYTSNETKNIFGFIAKKNGQYYAVINFKEIPLTLKEGEVPLHLIFSEDPANFALLLENGKKQLIWHNNERSEAFDVICNPRLTPDGKQLAFVGSNYVPDTDKKPTKFLGTKVQPHKILQSTVINGKKTSYPEGCLGGPVITKNPPGFIYTYSPLIKKNDKTNMRDIMGCNRSQGIVAKGKTQKSYKRKPYFETKLSNFTAIAPFETKFTYPKGQLQVLSKNFDYDQDSSSAYHGPFKIYYNKNYLGLVDYIFDAKLSPDEKTLGVLILQGNQIIWVVNPINPFNLSYKLE